MRYLIIGGTGSLGVHLTLRLLKEGHEVAVLSRDEYKQRNLMKIFPEVKYFVGDIRDRSRPREVMENIDIVVHAAALKHVPTGEEEPEEVLKTNLLGTMNVINSVLRSRVKRMIYISTDKGSHPVNVYGMTKALGEKMVISANRQDSKFVGVRYGNVIGSRGSVIEYILNEKPETMDITDSRMTRFWMNLDQACDIILDAVDTAEPGEIYIPKCKSLKVSDMFKYLDSNLELTESGMRPGEKLHECLVNKDESLHTIEHVDKFVILPEMFNTYKIKVPFEYTSENAPKLTKEEFLKLI